jgi:DNA-binding response OmpR family regulator
MRVPLVDDEEALAPLLRQILEHAGYVVEVARDGRDARRKVEASRPDPMVLDLMMPVMDGSSSGDRFRVRSHPGPAGGAAACLSKPFRFHELRATCAMTLAAFSRR